MNEKKLVILIAALTQLSTQLIANMVILAMPDMAVDLNLAVSYENGIYLMYLISLVAVSIPLSKVISQYGVKRSIIISNVAIIISLIVSALASDVYSIFFSRVIQGICVAVLLITIYMMIVNELPLDEVGFALGIVGSCGYIGMLLAPSLMSVILYFASWRIAFVLLMPLFVFQLILISCLDKEWTTPKKPIDKRGSFQYMLAIFLFVLGINYLDSFGWVSVAVSILLLFSFIRVEKRKENPIYNTNLLSDVKYVIGNYAAMVTYFISSITILILNYHLSYIEELSYLDCGLILLIMPIVMIFVSFFAGRLSDRYDPRNISGFAMIIIFISLVIFLLLNESTVHLIVIASFIQGIGHGLFSSPNNKFVLTIVDKKNLPDASALLSTSKEFGKMFSTTVYGLIFTFMFGNLVLGSDEANAVLISTDNTMMLVCIVICLSSVILLFFSRYYYGYDQNIEIVEFFKSIAPEFVKKRFSE